MFNKLLIDYNLKNKITKREEIFFKRNNIKFDFINTLPKKKKNLLFLTSDINKLNNDVKTIFLKNNTNNFIEKNDIITISSIYEISKIYKSDLLLSWAFELQFLAQNTLAYSKNKFDIERAKRIRDISCEMMSMKYDKSINDIKKNFAQETGYQTPKLENRAAIIHKNKILLVREQSDGKWAMPGGYQDANKSIRENIIKESYEEAGALVTPIKIVSIMNYNLHHEFLFPLGMVKIIILCKYIKHNFIDNIETNNVGFFDINNLPELSNNRTTKKQIELAFKCYNDKGNWEAFFE